MTNVATVPAPENPIAALITSGKARAYIEKFLPEGVDIERVAATLMLAVQSDKSKLLVKCTNESLILGIARIQQWGLELGVTAHLLPFKNNDKGTFEATPVADYKGLAELMIGSGAVRYLEPRVVYQGDTFDYRLGTDAKILHTPCGKAKRGGITHGYILIHLPGGRIVFDVMLAEDIDEIRQKYSKQWKNGPLPPWYVKKTLVRQSAKLIPKSPRFASAFANVLKVLDEEKGLELDSPVQSSPINALRAAVGDDDDEDRMDLANGTDGGEPDLDDREFQPPY